MTVQFNKKRQSLSVQSQKIEHEFEYESSSSYSSLEQENISDGYTPVCIRPSIPKIVMRADKPLRKKKSFLEYALRSVRKVDFVRKAGLIEYQSEESSSHLSVDSQFCTQRRERPSGIRGERPDDNSFYDIKGFKCIPKG